MVAEADVSRYERRGYELVEGSRTPSSPVVTADNGSDEDAEG